MLAARHHGRAFEPGPAPGDEPHPIAAGMSVDAEEAVVGHAGNSLI
jgi:hypothetical protein